MSSDRATFGNTGTRQNVGFGFGNSGTGTTQQQQPGVPSPMGEDTINPQPVGNERLFTGRGATVNVAGSGPQYFKSDKEMGVADSLATADTKGRTIGNAAIEGQLQPAPVGTVSGGGAGDYSSSDGAPLLSEKKETFKETKTFDTGVSAGVGSPLRKPDLTAPALESGSETESVRVAHMATQATAHSIEKSAEVRTIRESIAEQHELQFREIQDLRVQSDGYLKRALNAEDQLLVKATEIEALRRQLDAMVFERDTKWKTLQTDYDNLLLERERLRSEVETLTQRVMNLEESLAAMKRENDALTKETLLLRADRDMIYAKFLSIQTAAKKVHFGMQHVREGLDEIHGPANEIVMFQETSRGAAIVSEPERDWSAGTQQTQQTTSAEISSTTVGAAGFSGAESAKQPSAFKSSGIQQQQQQTTQQQSIQQPALSQGPPMSQTRAQGISTQGVAASVREQGFAISPSGTPIFNIPETTGRAYQRSGTAGAR